MWVTLRGRWDCRASSNRAVSVLWPLGQREMGYQRPEEESRGERVTLGGSGPLGHMTQLACGWCHREGARAVVQFRTPFLYSPAKALHWSNPAWNHESPVDEVSLLGQTAEWNRVGNRSGDSDGGYLVQLKLSKKKSLGETGLRIILTETMEINVIPMGMGKVFQRFSRWGRFLNSIFISLWSRTKDTELGD